MVYEPFRHGAVWPDILASVQLSLVLCSNAADLGEGGVKDCQSGARPRKSCKFPGRRSKALLVCEKRVRARACVLHSAPAAMRAPDGTEFTDRAAYRKYLFLTQYTFKDR